MPASPDDHLYLVDGSGFIFRAYHALPALTRKSDGMPVGAVSGFCNMIFKMMEDLKGEDEPSHVAVIFDASSVTFRNEIYDQYKAQRPEPPEDLRPQFGLIRDATRAFGLPCIEIDGYEADDIIATYARRAAAEGADVTIVSSDKDLMQLVDERDGAGRIGMVDLMKNKEIGLEEVMEKFGVGPDRVVDVQALAGDSVDNVPGAPGIGVKTAALLINEYGDLETLLERAEEIKQPKRRQSLIDNAELIRISKRLVTLDDQVPELPDYDELALKRPEPETLLAFLNEMEFRTITKRVAEALGADAPDEPTVEASPTAEPGAEAAEPVDREGYEIVRDEAALQAWIDAAHERGEIAVDTETTSLNEMEAELVGVCLSTAPGKACYIPLGHITGDGDLLGEAKRAEGQMDFDRALEMLKPTLEDPAILKIAQNMKYDLKIFARYGIDVGPFDDTLLLSYAQEAGKGGHGMDALSLRHLEHEPIAIKTLLGSGKSQITFDKVEIDKAAPYAAEDADVTFRLWKILKPGLVANGVTTVYETMERPLVPVLAAMERRGVLVDRDVLSRLSNAFSQKMAQLEDEIHELAGESFNVGSPKQLGEILFDKMSLEGGRKGKTGAYATGADVLETLAAQGHDLPARVLDWRQLSKLKGTYTDALQGHINDETGRVHTSYSIAGASTGRLASTDPNLQNIPVRSEEGRRIREAFVAAPGHVLLSLDYSQIELRLLAHIADIAPLKAA
ncbi:MAG: DNA polymerase I, partial [Pseudomonadota bacterium]